MTAKKDEIQTNPNKVLFHAKMVDMTIVDIMLPLATPKNNVLIKDKAIEVIEFFMEINKAQKSKTMQLYLDIKKEFTDEKLLSDFLTGQVSIGQIANEKQVYKCIELKNLFDDGIAGDEYKRAYKYIIDTFFVPLKRSPANSKVEGEDLQITNLENFEQFFDQILNYREIVNIYINLYQPFVDFLD